jgi:hypothetical protein
MASTGHTSTQARQAVQRAAMTNGRRGARSSARSGQVARQAPQPVQAAEMRTVPVALTAASPAPGAA